MKFTTICTFVDKNTIVDPKTGEATTLCHVVLQEPVKKSERNPYAFGTRGVDFYVKSEIYENFKKMYSENAKFEVTLDFKETYDSISKKRYYKRYIFAINGKEL